MPRPFHDAVVALPHWARVAIAARSARTVLSLFRDAWPNARPNHLTALEAAVQLAEESATNAIATAGLRKAVVDAVTTAAAALTPIHQQPMETESYPSDESSCRIAFTVARAAASAAEAAMNGPEDSVRTAADAYAAALQAAESAGASSIQKDLDLGVEKLIRHATKNRWTDETPVAPSTFKTLEDRPRPRPWWKFW